MPPKFVFAAATSPGDIGAMGCVVGLIFVRRSSVLRWPTRPRSCRLARPDSPRMLGHRSSRRRCPPNHVAHLVERRVGAVRFERGRRTRNVCSLKVMPRFSIAPGCAGHVDLNVTGKSSVAFVEKSQACARHLQTSSGRVAREGVAAGRAAHVLRRSRHRSRSRR